MTNPEPEEESVLAEAGAFEDEPAENPILGWAKAIVFGIGDTAKDALAEGRRGAREAMEQGWDRFDQKTKHRRS